MLRLGVAVIVAIVLGAGVGGQAGAQTPASGGPVDPAVIEDLVAASRILASEGVLDAYGHVSIRHPGNPDRYLMSRSLSPARVTAADIMEFDLDSNPVDRRDRNMFIERFIHGEIYKARPDVMAIVHSHSPGVIPFSITKVPLRPVIHTASFLWPGVPVYEIRDAGGVTDLLVRNATLAKALAATLGAKPVALLRGHGNVVVGKDVQTAVARAIYTEVNAKAQAIALGFGGPIAYISEEEGAYKDKQKNDETRAWNLWKATAMKELGK